MKYYIESDYEALSKKVCNILLDTVKNNPKAVIVLPTGYSPLGAYRLFVKQVREQRISLNDVTFIQLDEWAGSGKDKLSSCRYFLQKELLQPLFIESSHFFEFRGEAENLEEECARMEARMKDAGKISLVMLGVGKNGHIGLNEPEDVWHMPVHSVRLSQKSQSHSMLAQEQEKPLQGITLGISSFFQAEKILLIMSGSDKKEAVSSFFQDVVSPRCPVSILKLHANALCVIEEEVYRDAMTESMT